MDQPDSALFHIESYRIRGYDVDLHKRASIPSIIQMMHDAAMEHVLRIGLSALELDPLHLGWVLVRQDLEVFAQPGLGETVQVLTTPCGRDRAFAYRDFKLIGSSGEIYATMATTWLLMNTTTRRIAPYPDFILDWLQRTTRADHLPRPSGTLPDVEAPQREKHFQVTWHDLDFNRHLTNFYYQKWMLETVPVPILENYRLQSYRIQFKGESFLEETLTAVCQELEPGVFAHKITKEGREVTLGWTKWVPLETVQTA